MYFNSPINLRFREAIDTGSLRDVILFHRVLSLCEQYGVTRDQLNKYISEAQAQGIPRKKYLEGLIDTMIH